jgi:hypothetical protein
MDVADVSGQTHRVDLRPYRPDDRIVIQFKATDPDAAERLGLV